MSKLSDSEMEEPNPKMELAVHLGTILDLTITEIFILQLLMGYDKPTQRYALLQNINSCIPSRKPVTPGTLYRHLDEFERRGYVEYERNDYGKILTVSATPKTRDVLKEVLMMTSTGTADYKTALLATITQLKKEKSFRKPSRILFFDPSVPPRVAFIDRLMLLGENSYFLDLKDSYDVIFDMVGELDLKKSLVDEKVIREPNDYFDLVIVLGYEIPSFRKLLSEYLDEIHRTLSPRGQILFLTFNNVESTNNFILNNVSQVLNRMIGDDHEPEILSEYISDYGFDVDKTLNVSGFLVGWGSKPKGD